MREGGKNTQSAEKTTFFEQITPNPDNHERETSHDRSLRAARSLLFNTFLMDESRNDSEKMDKKEKSDAYDSPSDFWSVFYLKKYLRQRRHRTGGSKSFLEWSGSFQSPSGSGVCVAGHQAYWSLSLVFPSQS